MSSTPPIPTPAPPVGRARCVLRLYVAGGSQRSEWAIRNLTRICDEHLAGRVDLEIIDIYQQPGLAAEANLLAAPTLVKVLPLPPQRFIGILADERPLLAGIGVVPGEEDGST